MNARKRPEPVAALQAASAYSPPRSACPVDLRLDGNEGRTPDVGLFDALGAAGPEILRRYPDRGPLERRLAGRLGIGAPQVLVTAGADDALDRICRTYLDSSRNLVVAVPTFEMIPRYGRLAGAEIREAAWDGETFPVEAVLDLVDANTGIIGVVTPNNPTGAVATAEDLSRLSAAAPQAVLLVDLAYGEFADVDLTPAALGLPNAIAVHSLSKAWGLAGLRVGYAAGPEALIAPLRAAGGPYAVTGPSLLMAERALDETPGAAAFLERIRAERRLLREDLAELGARPLPSQGNFVYAPFDDARWVRDGLAGLGIAVRLFAADGDGGRLRITCPGDEAAFDRLERGLRTVLAPGALLLDMDGVLADTSESYGAAIRETVRCFGEFYATEEISAAKREPDSNNDWVVTRRLLAERGVAVGLEEVTDRFQRIYADLAQRETLIPEAGLVERLAARIPLGIVTGRPRAEAEAFLARFGIRRLFGCLVCLEDAPGKPDPAPVRLALQRLGTDRAWMVGDTVNDIAAARAAGVLPLGIVPPDQPSADYPELLVRSGAGRTLTRLSELEEVLPL